MSLIGDYKLVHDVIVGNGFSTGTVPAGTSITVKRVDDSTNKVLVQFGNGGDTDWFSTFWLSANTDCIAL